MNHLPILNYHGIEAGEGEYAFTDVESPYVLSLSDFLAQLSSLLEGDFQTLSVVQLKEWFDWKSRDRKPLMITFDDGHISHFDHAVPALKQRGMNAVFFISAGLIGKKGQMDWAHLRQVLSGGFDIGSHGFNHIPLMYLSEKELAYELEASKKTLEDGLNASIDCFSVPRGFYDPRIEAAARKIGYRFVCTSQFNINQRKQNPYRLCRLVVKKGISHDRFESWIHGRLGPAKQWETLKGHARNVIPPAVYDKLADVKRALK